ncbi:MAG TPA: cytidine deaminase [Candidatus Eisenbacteria bacterium]|nr:cytidine deaminase [Candidatus Eisenbacteria bacterium]
MQADESQLLQAASAAAKRAYAPYSHVHVGASLSSEAGHIYSGCNVENASYGLTICAERVAVFAAVAAEGPEMRIKCMAIMCDKGIVCSPCGACRQVIAEFGREAQIIYEAGDTVRRTTAAELLPEAFDLG